MDKKWDFIYDTLIHCVKLFQVYSKNDFILPKNESDSGWCFASHELENSFKSFFCFEFKLTGVSTLTWQSRSPEPLCLIAGMPFLGDLDENMRAQRLETPRVKVPKGSVALTEQFANIYTFESPGGWNILGNTPLDVFDSSKEDKPNLINPGDTVIFKEITLDQYKNYNE